MTVDGIPDQLRDYDLLKIYGPGANCDHPGKQPVGSTTEGPFYRADDPELADHVRSGGNVGIPLNGSLVVIDVDHDRFGELLGDHLPATFTIRSGGGGEHRYYEVPGWSDDRQLTVDGTDYGSIRSDGWQVVIPPSIHPETGEQYRVLEDREIATVDPDEIVTVLEAVDSSSQHSGAAASSGGAAAGCAGGSTTGLPAIPDRYPEKDADWNRLRSWLEANGLLTELRKSSGDRSAREFKLAKCLAEGGFSEASISYALDRLPYDSKWHEREGDYRQRTVRKAIVAACEDEYVSFPDDGKESGSDLPEGKRNRTRETMSSNNSVDFTDKLAVPILEGSEDGDSFKKVVLVEGNDDGETFEYLALKKGHVQEATTTDGNTVLVENVEDSVSLGSPEYLDELIDGLEAMQEKLDG